MLVNFKHHKLELSSIGPHLLFVFALCLVSVFSVSAKQAKQTTINVSLLTNFHDDWRIFNEIFSEFESRHPLVEIVLHASEDSRQRKLNQTGETQADMAFVQLSTRHCQEFHKGKHGAISQQWLAFELDRLFSKGIKNLVSCGGKVIALPLGFYSWGFFYHKSFFAENDFSEPQNWVEFIRLLNAIKRKTEHAPINLGSKDAWVTGVWFDYLNMRVNGRDFHKQTLSGSIPFTDKRIINTFERWRELLSNDMFLKNHKDLGWDDSYSFFLRGETQLILSSTNLSGSFNKVAEQNKLGYFSFPHINEKVKRAEDIPLDGFVFSPSFLNSSYAKKLIQFLSSEKVQQALAEKLNYYPANRLVPIDGTILENKIRSEINKSNSFMRFFDRDTDKQFAKKATILFQKFMLDRDITQTTQALEKLRLELLSE
jgi:multiple sugar transport system substrate-binding protein